MGSVKDLIMDDSLAGRLYVPPTPMEFGMGAWLVKDTFSVGDLKKEIPESNIKSKAEALTMMVGRFFEWFEARLAGRYRNQPLTCYLGLMDKDGKITDVQALLDRGDTSNIVVMRLAHVPETYCNGGLKAYREDLKSGELQCGVADVESIFRKGFPLGSSTFEKIFKAVGMGKEYQTLSTYDETVKALDEIRSKVDKEGLSNFPELEKILRMYYLGTTIPNPGFVLKSYVYDTTTKFEEAGDRDITREEARIYSGLDSEGYDLWNKFMFPELTVAQIEFSSEKKLLNIDGKGECVAYKRKPVITDFACTPDENRLMIVTNVDGVEWAIPSNKEIQRAIFRKEGIYAAISEAKHLADKDGDIDKWRSYFQQVIKERNIDLKGVTEHSCNLMSYAVVEVANRILGRDVFEAKPLESWTREFLPYASRIEMQK